MGKNLEARMAKLEAVVNEVLGPPPPTPEEVAAKAAAWNAMCERWASALIESMDVARHQWVLHHWAQHLLRQCEVRPCAVLPPGLIDHLNILWSWKWDETKPVALPPEVVEVYLQGDRLNCRPHVDCERCGYILPISFFFMQDKQVCHFERCPLDNGFVGWHAYDIKHQANGWHNLVPYSQRG
jgi:hypothetical protein